jgi:hypothetical protein
MNTKLSQIWTLIPAASLMLLAAAFTGCLGDDKKSDPAEENSGGSGNGGEAGADQGAAGDGNEAGQGNVEPNSGVCAVSTVLPEGNPGIADFDLYDGASDLTTWSFALGGDSSTGVYAGPFAYGDEADGFPELFTMVDGDDSTYAFSISDTLAEEYGGGMGLWLSGCIDASVFSGIAFAVRGVAPIGTAKLSLVMSDTTSATEGDTRGTCSGATADCIHPYVEFPVTEEWTVIEATWDQFSPGSAAGTVVSADGSNIWQLQVDVGVEWIADASGTYVGTPAPYEFVIDSITFF